MRPELHPWRLSPLNVKDTSYSVTSFSIQHILFWQAVPRTQMTEKIGFEEANFKYFFMCFAYKKHDYIHI